MKWYTAIGCKMEDDEGRLLVKIDGQEKVLTEMEGMLWAALTWSLCAENRIYSQKHGNCLENILNLPFEFRPQRLYFQAPLSAYSGNRGR